jgi:hypothetical protein
MASEKAGKHGPNLSSALGFLKNFTLNSWRRLLMLGHYTVICFQRQRLCRAWRLLGQRVHQALESGEVNPMLADEVKDSLAKAQALQTAKDRHYQTIAALREKIRATRAEAAPPSPEAEPAPPPPQPETAAEVKPEPIILGEPETVSTPEPEGEAEAAKESEPEKPQG